MTELEMEEWSKYIYQRLLNLDYYENLSTSAYDYLEKHKTLAEHDYLEDLAMLDINICWEYFQRQPVEYCAEIWKKLENKDNSLGYDPIQNTLTSVIYHKLFGEEFNQNEYHPVKFYVEFGIIVDLDTFEQIKGEDIGGWCNAWDNPQRILNKYKSLSTSVIHPSRKETLETLENDLTATQMTIFDLQ